MAAVPAPAAASGVALQLQGSARPVLVSSDQISALADVPATPYRVRSRPGRAVETIKLSGTRLASVLRAAGVDPATVPTLEITRSDGSILYLTRDELDPAAGPPPLLYASGRSMGFARTSRGAGDVNAADLFTTSSGTPIRITVSRVAVLRVLVHASDTRIAPRARVHLEAEVEGALPGEELTYEWRLGDGHTAAGEETSHRFAARGRYEVMLRVTGDQASGGSSQPVVVQVGPPLEAAGDGGGGSSRRHEAPAAGPIDGPQGSGGGAGSAAGAAESSSGAGTGPAARRPASRSRPPTGTDRGPGVLAGRTLSAASAAPPAPPARATSPARAGTHGRGLAAGWLAGAIACLLLVGLGGGAEWRAGSRRRARVLGAPRG